MGFVLSAVLIVVIAAGAAFLAFVLGMRRTSAETTGNRYYGLPAAGRAALKTRIAARSRRLRPLLQLLGRLRLPTPIVDSAGMCTPGAVTTAASVAASARFVPGAHDVFVATQAKCGTTWMQQLVYEVLMRGQGDFGDAGHGHLYATSPWIEATFGVAMDDAPRLGEEGWRLIKTHLPADRCPYSPEAMYIYVTRHPVACFSSMVDFVRMLAGPLAPPREGLLDVYLSDRMFWRAWPDHVEGWWRLATERQNVLFVHYEEMLDDLPAVVERVARLLGVELAPDQLAEVVRKSGFDYMKAEEERFEMSPPTLMQGVESSAFLRNGTREREREGSTDERARIMRFCRERLANATYPLASYYPE